MKKYAVLSFLILVPFYGLCKATEELVRSMIPGGSVRQEMSTDFTVRTIAGTKVMVEFDQQGSLDEASGLNLGSGDIFEPGEGLLSLETTARKLTEQGHKVRGLWRLEKDLHARWYYELQVRSELEDTFLQVDARSAKVFTPSPSP
jgi:hypothetical protein